MTAQCNKSPDKPAGFLKNALRKLIRETRWIIPRALNPGRITKGRNCYFGKRSEIYIPCHMVLGNNISIGSYWLTQVNLSIGDDTLISSRVSFIGHDHDLFDKATTSYFSGRLAPSKIVLEGNNFIGFGATLLGNITIGKDSIIAAGSLVNKSVPPNVIVAGIPAKVIGPRYKLHN